MGKNPPAWPKGQLRERGEDAGFDNRRTFRSETIVITTKEKVAEIGPLKIEKDKTHAVPLSPVLGVLALVGGIALLVVGKRA